MQRWCIMMLAASAALLAGCATYQAVPISTAEEAANLESRTLNDPHLREFVSIGLTINGTRAAPSSWNLDRLTLAAIYYHPDLDISRAKLASARAGVITAAQIPNPSLNVGGFYNGTVLAPSPWNVGTMVNFLLETFGKRQYRIAQADELVEAARYDLATATWQVRAAVRTALLDLWAANQRVTLTKQRLDFQNQLVGFLESRLKAGQASSLDVTRERINRNQITLALSDAQRQAADARVQLATAIGIPVSALDGVDLSFAAFNKQVPISGKVAAGNFRRQALLYRSDIQGLLAEYAAAQSALQLAVANQFPNLSLGPGYTYDQGDNKYDLSLSADLPIFNQNQGPIAEASARRREVVARFTSLQAQIIGEIDSAVARYRAVTRTLSTANALLADEQGHLREVSRSFAAGEVDHPTLVTAELELAAIELSRFDAVVQQRQAIGALEDALQRPLFDPGHWPVVTEQDPRLPQSEPAL